MRNPGNFRPGRRIFLAFGVTLAVGIAAPAVAAQTIKIGLVTSLSGQSARAGEALTRGLGIAIDELNAAGGVLGKKFELVRRDDEALPTRGVIAARELIYKEKVAVLFGGFDTPVSLAIVPLVNALRTPFMVPWAAGTRITHNGAASNYVFRVSAVDEIVDKAMLRHAQATFRTRLPGMILVNNPWGESNEKGLHAALAAEGMQAAGVEKFEANEVDVVPQLTRLRAAGADTLFLIGNAGPAAQVVKSLDRMGWKVPVVSHWGPAGGRFTELAGPSATKVHFVQTYSFFGKQSPVGEKVIAMLRAKYPDVKGPSDITPAVGVANAYDAMHLVAEAIKLAGATDGNAIREGFYRIVSYDGLIKRYDKPFSAANHDALNEDDYVWAHFVGDQIVPIGLDK